HNTRSRPIKLNSAYKLIANEWDEPRATLLFKENPRKALAGQAIDPPEPLPIEPLKRKGMLNPLSMIKNLFTTQ
ncbi:hypothetical protein MJD09_08985, partial [bacterium]|nr:hypothetical protein [bacterium]